MSERQVLEWEHSNLSKNPEDEGRHREHTKGWKAIQKPRR